MGRLRLMLVRQLLRQISKLIIVILKTSPNSLKQIKNASFAVANKWSWRETDRHQSDRWCYIVYILKQWRCVSQKNMRTVYFKYKKKTMSLYTYITVIKYVHTFFCLTGKFYFLCMCLLTYWLFAVAVLHKRAKKRFFK